MADAHNRHNAGKQKAAINPHIMVVQQNGVTVATNDASYGSGYIMGDLNRVTPSVQLSPADGDAYDWAIPWTEWTPCPTTESG